jgi:DNA-binding MurR/RpiR family transcriptional regulator
VDFYGLGASALIARDAAQKFLRIGKMCFAFDDHHMQATSAVSLTEQDVVVGISYSGETREIIDVLTLAKETGATVMSLTKCSANSVAELADIKLYTSSLEKSIRSGAMASRIAQLNVIDILFIGVASQDYEQAYDQLERTRNAIQQWLKK